MALNQLIGNAAIVSLRWNRVEHYPAISGEVARAGESAAIAGPCPHECATEAVAAQLPLAILKNLPWPRGKKSIAAVGFMHAINMAS